MVQKPGNEEDFMPFKVELFGFDTFDKKKRDSVKLVDVEHAEQECILKETYDTTLGAFPSYIPKSMVRSWVKHEVTDEIIRNPTLEN